MNKLLLIDGNSLMFRAYYSTAYSGRLMTTKDGFTTNAIHGFISMMNKLQKDFDFTHVLVAFDTAKKTFRHDMLDTYKDGRAAMPEDFKPQIPLLKDFLDLSGIKRYEIEGFEADDIIGSMAKACQDANFETIDVITGDKDMLQLVSDCVTVHITRKGVTELESYTPVEIMEKYETTPDKMPDLKGMMGDTSDNLPGIPGVGEKTAIKLLKQFGSLEALLERTDELKGKQKENVENNKDMARLCKEMATIATDMTTLPTIADIVPTAPDVDGLKALFTQLEFNAFLKNLGTGSAETVAHVAVPEMPAVLLVESVSMLDGFEFADCVLHVEVFEPNYHDATIVGFGLMMNEQASYIPFSVAQQSDKFIHFLQDESVKKEMFDAKRATVALKWAGITLSGVVGDVLLKAYVLNPSTADLDIGIVANHYDVTVLTQPEEVYGKGAKRTIPEPAVVANHVGGILTCINQLTGVLSEALKEANQWVLYQEIELPLTFILAQMEFDGMKVDVDILKGMNEALGARIKVLESDIHELAGTTFNVGSPKQLGVVLFEDLGLKGKKSKTGNYSTSADVLEKLKDEHPIIEKILSYRTLTKLFSTYIEGLQKACFSDGMVHTIFNQALTQTGRLSSTDPNLQNIPIRLEEGRLIRKAFVPSREDHVLIGADYSQIELRILAHVSQTKSLIDAFNSGADVHVKTASEVFNVNPEEVTDEMRRGAKAINFGIVYGQSAFGLSEALNISMAEAKHYIEDYLTHYQGIKNYMDQAVKDARDLGYVQTLFLRRRYMPDIEHKNFMVRQGAERTAINAPIQGSAADIIKVAMIEVHKAINAQGVKSKMILQVHDELLFDVPKEELSVMLELVKTAMEGATTLDVPLTVEANSGENWFMLK